MSFVAPMPEVQHLSWVLLDEREARRIAKTLWLKVTGILGILLRARREGKLPSLQRAMEELREKAGFRIERSYLPTL